MQRLELDLSNAVKEIKKGKAKRVLLQLPEGLKTRATEIIKKLEKTDAEVICLVDPCFGACDLALQELQVLNADLVVHLGHEKLLKDSGKTVFVPLGYEIEGKELMELKKEFLKKLKECGVNRIALAASIQYLNYLKEFREEAEREGMKAFLEKNNAAVVGQVLGCDVSALKKLEKKVQGIVFLGDGLFHPLAISFAVKKPLLVINPLEGNVEWFEEKERDKLFRKRILMIEKARKAEGFGILVSSKEGQARMEKVIELKKLIEASGKKAFIFAADLLLPDYLLGIAVDCFVSTACPRIALEDFSVWRKPVINAEELKILFGKKKIEEYCFEELF